MLLSQIMYYIGIVTVVIPTDALVWSKLNILCNEKTHSQTYLSFHNDRNMYLIS